MLYYLLLLFTLVPLVELALLIRIGQVIDWPATIGLVVLTGIVGWWLARREGLRTLTRLRAELEAGQLPADRMIDALLILVAGAVLVTPGVLTDAIGFLLLIPPARSVVRRRLKAFFRSRFVVMDMNAGFRRVDDDLIDVEARPSDNEHRPG